MKLTKKQKEFLEWISKKFRNPYGYFTISESLLEYLKENPEEIESFLYVFGDSQEQWESRWWRIADELMIIEENLMEKGR